MKRISVILAFLLFFAAPFVSVSAAANENMDKVAVALVIDNSGSMKNTDPLLNRFTASQMVLDLLTDSDYLSIITFSDEAQTLMPMAQLTGDQINKAKISLKSVPQANGYTDYFKAISEAERSLSDVPEGTRKVIIFLTDGVPEIRNKTVDFLQYMTILRNKIVDIGNQGTSIFTVGFGDSDQAFLTEISGLTRGTSLHGASSDVAVSFFNILQELKNRYSLVDTEVSALRPESFQFTVDEYTSRITILVNDKTGSGTKKVRDAQGNEVQPQFETDQVSIFHLNEVGGSESKYTVETSMDGTVRAVRDTKTKLWINEPENNAQLPFESDIKALILQTGISNDNTIVNVKLAKNGVPVAVNPIINKLDSAYEINLGKLPQTGQYEMEVTLNHKNRLIAKTSSRFFLANIPILNTNILDENAIWIQDEDRRITAELVKSRQVVTREITNAELSLEITQGTDRSTILLRDDGKVSSGDLIANDGVYSGWLRSSSIGKYTAKVTARGYYQNQPFFLIVNSTAQNLMPAGRLKVSVPTEVSSEASEISIQINNEGGYDEELTVFVNGIPINVVPVKVGAGNSVQQKIKISVNNEAKTVGLDFKANHSATIIESNSHTVTVNKANGSQNIILQFGLIGLAMIGVILVIFLFLRKRSQKLAPTLSGELMYQDKITGETKRIVLNGKGPMEFSIGREQKVSNHIFSETEPSFRFQVYPIYSEKGNHVIELKCSPPGTLSIHGLIMTSTILSSGNQFEMGGLLISYELNQSGSDGQDLLTGRL